jgi:hypothetical protein
MIPAPLLLPSSIEPTSTIRLSQLLKGKGASSNPDSRFSAGHSESVDDGWPQEEMLIDRGKPIISTNQSPDIPFDQSINPYLGCEHGCIYCYARPSHAFADLSPSIDFETKIIAKPNADNLLRQALIKRTY